MAKDETVNPRRSGTKEVGVSGQFRLEDRIERIRHILNSNLSCLMSHGVDLPMATQKITLRGGFSEEGEFFEPLQGSLLSRHGSHIILWKGLSCGECAPGESMILF